MILSLFWGPLMRFDKYDLSPEIQANLQEIGFHRTTDIQFKTIPAILDGEDVLAIAQTGTGKTAAFAIPIIEAVSQRKRQSGHRGIQSLVLVPTRELAKQIGQVFARISRNTKATSYAIYGGVDQDPQIRQLLGGVDILIATPGRMFDLIHQQFIDVSRVQTLVLDEADHMLDLGFIGDIQSIKRKLEQRHQTLFFSATINPKIKKMAYSQIRSNALRIQVSPEKMVSKNLKHSLVKVEMDDKRHLLVNILKGEPDGKYMVFARTQVRVERVLKHLAKNDIQAFSIHGGMEQDEREGNLDAYRHQKSGVMVATDVSARGIDLPGITFVINYDLPDDPEYYVHRIGRTGRGFEKGEALSFYSPEENEKLDQIQEFLNIKIPLLKADKEALEQPVEIDLEDISFADMIAEEESKVKRRKKRRK